MDDIKPLSSIRAGKMECLEYKSSPCSVDTSCLDALPACSFQWPQDEDLALSHDGMKDFLAVATPEIARIDCEEHNEKNSVQNKSITKAKAKSTFCDDEMEEQYRLRRLRKQQGVQSPRSPPRMTHYHRQRVEIDYLSGLAKELIQELEQLQRKKSQTRQEWQEKFTMEQYKYAQSAQTNAQLKQQVKSVLHRRQLIEDAIFGDDFTSES